jgi:hypothetical protein
MQVGAVFGIIFAIIVMAIVLVFGSGMITDMMCMGSLGQTNKVIDNLNDMTDRVQSLDEGSSTPFDVNLPSSARLCFVDPEHPNRSIIGDWMPDPGLFIEDEIHANGYNMWIEYNCGSSDTGLYMKYLATESNFCVKKGDRLLLTNTGISVNIKKL